MSSRLRVLHVQHSLAPGGMENGVVNVAQALPADEFEIHVCCLEKSGDFARRLPDPGNVHELHKGEGFSIGTVLKLRRLIRTVSPDVIHSHNLGALIYSALATGFGRTRPVIHGEHGVPDDGPEGARRQRQRRLFFKAARRIHTVSFGLRDFFLQSGFPEDQIVALINGVDTERFCPGDSEQARGKLGIAPETPVALIVGRLIESKGHRVLFRAFEKVVEKFPEAVLLVVGDGGDAKETIYELARKSPVASSIRMEGYQSDPVKYYNAADLLVAPSTIEGLSNVVLEAMACGLPSLLHDACGNREVITPGKDGVIADLSGEAGLARELMALLGDQGKMSELGQTARKTVEERFSMRGMAEAYASVYREVAG